MTPAVRPPERLLEPPVKLLRAALPEPPGRLPASSQWALTLLEPLPVLLLAVRRSD